jgi:hypothetical protein
MKFTTNTALAITEPQKKNVSMLESLFASQRQAVSLRKYIKCHQCELWPKMILHNYLNSKVIQSNKTSTCAWGEGGDVSINRDISISSRQSFRLPQKLKTLLWRFSAPNPIAQLFILVDNSKPRMCGKYIQLLDIQFYFVSQTGIPATTAEWQWCISD